MPRALKVTIVVGVLVFLLSAWALATLPRRSGAAGLPANDTGPTRPPPSLMFIPPFTLIDQDEKPVTREDLLGRVTILDFVFTHCPFVCPVLTEKMSEAAAALKGTPVRLLSISVDPVRDTPAALREYAKLHEADTTQWRFLTGEKAQLDAIITDGLKFALTEDPTAPINLPGGGTMNNIIHPSWIVLIGPDANVFSLYRSSDEEHMRQMVIDAKELLREVK